MHDGKCTPHGAERHTNLGCKLRDRFALMPWHVDSLPIPSRLVVRIKTESGPHLLSPFSSPLLRESLLNDNVTVLHEELDLFG